MSMSWNEFKKNVETQLQEQKIDPDSEIWYIDISFPEEWIEVGYNKTSGITVD